MSDDIDRAVAERVLGWVKGMNFFGHEAWFRGDELVADAETWTADSAEGMLAVIEAMSDREWQCELYREWGQGLRGATFFKFPATPVQSPYSAKDASLPRAVALAALAAVGGGE